MTKSPPPNPFQVRHQIFAGSIPSAQPSDIIEWAERLGIKVDGHSFDSARNPRILDPMRAMCDSRTRIGTLIKPVQDGGSTAGEVVCAYWASFFTGLIQYNWQDDDKAKDRWFDRIKPTLDSCADIRRTGGRFSETICEARYVNSTVRVQGVFNESSLDSDTIPLQLNEEIHLWKSGFLGKARRRQTQVWNAKGFDISNASNVGDQLHSAWLDGTMQEWEILCPKCGGLHVMHFRWNPDKPELGGLRYNTDGCRMKDGRFDYNKLERTIRYQMPCGHEVKDTALDRRRLKGYWSLPRNEGAHISHRSWNYEGVACEAIGWLALIQEWHSAVRALKVGDIQPMRRFVTERECKFWSEESIPFSGIVIVNKMLTKSRKGLKGRAARFWFADKQKGYKHKGELTHYWLVIRDVMKNADSLVVFEGMVQTDADLLARLQEHECVPQSGAVDCGWDRENVLQLCYRNNFNAQTSSSQDKLFFHVLDRTYKIYSKPDGLHKQLKVPPKFDYSQFRNSDSTIEYVPNPEEPMHWNIHKVGSLKLLAFLRGHKELVEKNGGTDFIKWEVPGDVSDEYKHHLESWEFTTRKKPGTNETVEVCRQRFPDDHMLMCEAGIANLIAMAPHPEFPTMSILSVRLAQMGITEDVVGGKQSTTIEEEKK